MRPDCAWPIGKESRLELQRKGVQQLSSMVAKSPTTYRRREQFGTTTIPTTPQSSAIPRKYLEGSLGEADELTDSCPASISAQKTMPLGFACLDCIMRSRNTPHLGPANRVG